MKLNTVPTLMTLEWEIQTWQQVCLRKFSPLDGGQYQLRVLPLSLANGKPWLRYGQHWTGAARRRPLNCPACTDPTALEQPGECPLCQALDGDYDHPSAVRLSYLLYCFVLVEDGAPVVGDHRFRMHQWWMPPPIFNRFHKLGLSASTMGFGVAQNLQVTCEGTRLTLDLGDVCDLQIPETIKERVTSAAVSPRRRVRWEDLKHAAFFLQHGSPVLNDELEPEY